MKKTLIAIIAVGALALAIPASGFNVTISANADNAPWACYGQPGTTLPGGHAWLPWNAAAEMTGDVPTGSYNWVGKWAHFHEAVTFDVDGSGNVQNIQPPWGGNGEGTSTLNITGPRVEYGFTGNAGSLSGLFGPGHYGWVGGDNVTTGVWPSETGRPKLVRHPSSGNPPGLPEINYLTFRINSEGKVHDVKPETGGVFAVDAAGKASNDTSGEAIDIGGAYVVAEPSLVPEQAGVDFNSYRFNDIQDQIDSIESTPGPQGSQGKVGSDGPVGDQGPQGKLGDTGAAAPCVTCETLSDATFDLATALLLADPSNTVTDFQSTVQAIGTVATVGAGGNICEPIPGDFATCMEYIIDQVQTVYDSQ